ncbi:MAG TPA: tRNA lysidine(34) synthetase TilS [Alphaproteobacteria bacterium]|jgi:tRNA(Ile)-lysidine synthase|nr:tRNA lysidine(34) synthetase TilS [Alphaproteobacteria bacterium]
MLSSVEFARTMESFAPFESRPHIAVALSGGPDSLALLLLTDRWVRERGGAAIALTVDHGLRHDSASEAAQVGAWAGARGIAHEILPWTGDKPHAGIQAAARQARYRLLSAACAERAILHLAFAHHADDQAETVLFRRERGSGAAGLAGMTVSRSLGPVRMIRPLLGWTKSVLVETCRHFGQNYVEDPSNSSARFARTGLRRRLTDDAGLRAAASREAAAQAARRIEDENRLADALGRIAEIRPDGVAFLDPDALSTTVPGTRQAVLAATLRSVGGSEFAPDADAIRRLDRALAGAHFGGVSLSGCIVRRWRGRILVCREPKRAAPPLRIDGGEWLRWDGRFVVRTAAANGPVTVGALGSQADARLRRSLDGLLPAIAGAGLPAVRFGDRVVSVPPVGWEESGFAGTELHYSPLWPLSPETFTVVSAVPDIMSDGLGVLAATQ